MDENIARGRAALRQAPADFILARQIAKLKLIGARSPPYPEGAIKIHERALSKKSIG